MQANALHSIWRSVTDHRSQLISLVVLGWSIDYTVTLAVVHNSGPEQREDERRRDRARPKIDRPVTRDRPDDVCDRPGQPAESDNRPDEEHRGGRDEPGSRGAQEGEVRRRGTGRDRGGQDAVELGTAGAAALALGQRAKKLAATTFERK